MRVLYTYLIVLAFLSLEGWNMANSRSGGKGYVLDSAWAQASSKYVVSQPTGIGIDKNDHIFVFQRTGRRWTNPFPDSFISQRTVLELDGETGGIINSWGQNYFIMPHGLTVDSDNNVWVTDVGLHQVFKFTHEGKLLMKLGTARVPGNDSSHFNLPTDVAVGDDGAVYISDGYGNSRVAKFSSSGRFLKAWGDSGSQPGKFDIPHAIAINRKSIIYVADRENNRIQLFDTSGRFIKVLTNNAQVEQLPSVGIDMNDRVFAIDYDSRKRADGVAAGSTFFAFDSTEHPGAHFAGTDASNRNSCWFHDIAIDSRGNVYVGDIARRRVLKFKPVE